MSTLFKIISGMCSLNLHHSSKYIYHQYPHRYPNTQQSSVQFAKTHQFQSSFFLGTTTAWNNLNFNVDEILLQIFKLSLWRTLSCINYTVLCLCIIVSGLGIGRLCWDITYYAILLCSSKQPILLFFSNCLLFFSNRPLFPHYSSKAQHNNFIGPMSSHK